MICRKHKIQLKIQKFNQFALNFFPWHLSRFMAIKIFNIEIPEIRVQASATAINELDATNDLI